MIHKGLQLSFLLVALAVTSSAVADQPDCSNSCEVPVYGETSLSEDKQQQDRKHKKNTCDNNIRNQKNENKRSTERNSGNSPVINDGCVTSDDDHSSSTDCGGGDNDADVDRDTDHHPVDADCENNGGDHDSSDDGCANCKAKIMVA